MRTLKIVVPSLAVLVLLGSSPSTSGRPPTGDPETLSGSGKLWRIPGVHLAWNHELRLYLAVWHDTVVFDDPPQNHGHPSHYWLTSSTVRCKAIQVGTNGHLGFGPELAIGPNTAGFAAFGPRVEYNAKADEFLVVWSEGKWEFSTAFDEDGDGLAANDPDLSLFGDWVTDNDDDDIAEYAYSQDPYAPNSRIVARRVTVDATTLAATIVGATIEVSMGTGGVAGNPSGVPGGATDPTAIHPAILPDVSWDGAQYVVTWQTLEDPQLGTIENLTTQGYQLRHIFHAQSRGRFRTFAQTGAATSGFVDLSNAKARFLIKGPPSNSNIVDGSVPGNLANEKSYGSVTTDPTPRVDSLILPGPDNALGTADDVLGGSLIAWSVTTLVFNTPKSRVRGRFLGAGAGTAGIVWDIFSPEVQLVQRAAVIAGPSREADNQATTTNEALALSHFLVTFQTVEDTVKEGDRLVEYVGSLKARMTEEDGRPSGPVIDIANSDATQTFLSPSGAWCSETEQFFLTWTRTDKTLWNPYTHGRSWHPKSWSMLDVPVTPAPGPRLTTVASVYPVGMPVSYSGLVNASNPYATQYHLLYAGQEDDFGANFVGWYRFPNPGNAYVTPGLGLTPGTLAFTTTDAQTTPPSQNMTVSNTAGGTSVLNWQLESDQAWVTLSQASGQLGSGASETVGVSVSPAGLPNGTYTAILTATSPTALESPKTMTVTLEVGAANVSGGPKEDEDGGGGGGGCGGSLIGIGAAPLWMLLGLAALFLRRR